ncbi:MAG TPA: hypothetical protein VHX61_20580 [Rhizomicrobium sp.]|nr:hypothetical protein [Rhizomicrobium sp.]
MTDLGRIVFGIAFAILGALFLGFHDFALTWIPKIIAWRDVPATVIGVLLLAGGVALLVPRAAGPSALLLAALLLVRFLFLMRFVVAEPLVEGHYEEAGEALAQIAGAWTIFAMLAPDRTSRFGGIRAGQILFALALLPFGLSHFFYLNMTAPLIPSWIPFHVPLSYLTGAAHFAAGIAILILVLPRLAATLEAVMVSLFTLIVWVPVMVAAPMTRANWSEIVTSAAISGAAWAVAGSFGRKSWSLARG